MKLISRMVMYNSIHLKLCPETMFYKVSLLVLSLHSVTPENNNFSQKNFVYPGSNCTTSSNYEGICVTAYLKESRCKHFYLTYLDNGQPEICYQIQNEKKTWKNMDQWAYWCCPHPEQFRQTGKRAKAACEYYHGIERGRFPFPPGYNEQPSYGGSFADIHEFPHVVSLGYNTSEGYTIAGCGGTVISDEYILTAAHCVFTPELGTVAWARLGATILNETSDGKTVPILDRIVHPRYKRPSYYHDIALLRIEQFSLPLYRFLKIVPACLHTYTDIGFTPLTIIGWGKTHILSEPSNRLVKTNVSLVAHQECKQRYAGERKWKLADGIDFSSQLCAGSPEGNDACKGDSGGPLHAIIPQTGNVLGHFRVVGITSFGKGCAGGPSAGVFTRVSGYVKWIENIVWPMDS